MLRYLTPIRLLYSSGLITGVIFRWQHWEATSRHLMYATLIYLFMVIPMAMAGNWKLQDHEEEKPFEQLKVLRQRLGSVAVCYAVSQAFFIFKQPSFTLAGLVMGSVCLVYSIHYFIDIFHGNEE